MQTMPYPAKKNDKLIAEVLDRLSLGETLTSISRDLKFSTMSWGRWLEEDEELAQAHTRARLAGTDAVADHVMEIVDTPPERHDGKIDNGSIAWARNRAEYRLKLLGHWRPDKYGTKTTTEITGKDGKEINLIDAEELALRLGARLRSSKRDAE
jgi:hypothetical protein